MKKHRNTIKVKNYSDHLYRKAIDYNLMQVGIKRRDGKRLLTCDNKEVIEFVNCSYLGLDLHPNIISSGKSIDDSWGVNFCCARSRFSIEPLFLLEDKLSQWLKGVAISFPSVTTTHMNVLPLLASGLLIDEKRCPKTRLIIDKYAHASMQFLKPILADESTIKIVDHNNISQILNEILQAKKENEIPIYIADGVYSMGGLCPIKEILDLTRDDEFYMYIDDAHGTSIIGENGEGSVLSMFEKIPENIFLSFSLSKGFGCNGGGIVVSNNKLAHIIKSYGQIYSFSAALDFSVINSCLASLELHNDGTVKMLQEKLRDNVSLFDRLMNISAQFSPIRMIDIGDEEKAINAGKFLLESGFFVSVVFFPVVGRGRAQLRICISASHTEEQIGNLASCLKGNVL